MSAERIARQTSVSSRTNARCSNVTIPWFGLDLDSRTLRISVSTRIVSPSKSGAGKTTSLNPRLATVVPVVISPTLIPTTSASVNIELNSGFPNSVLAA